MRKLSRGFTLVEILTVAIIIAILATITMVAYNGVQARARDTVRKNDLAAIAEAIALYRQKCDDDVRNASSKPSCGDNGAGRSGCGWSGQGSGWFNYVDGGTYSKSILSCLQDAGYLRDGGGLGYADPFHCTTTDGLTSGLPSGTTCLQKGFAYMKYSSASTPTVTCLYARLEASDDSAKLKDASSANPCVNMNSVGVANSYGMNYMVVVD